MGSHSITASYSGDANFLPSSSTSFSVTVVQETSNLTLVANYNPSSYGQTVSFYAYINPQYGNVTGVVTFQDAGTSIGSAQIGANVAIWSTSTLSTGTHSITATFSGNANVLGSSSNTVAEVVNQAGSITRVVTSASPSSVGQPVTFTVTVSPQFAGIPTGKVVLENDSTVLATLPLTSGQASYTTSSLKVGSWSIFAFYGGDTNFNSSSSPGLTQVVTKSPTTTTVTSSANPSSLGQAVLFTAMVVATGGVPPDGELVTFKDSGVKLGTGILSGGNATFTASSLDGGSHNIVATYSGDGSFSASASAKFVQTVNKYSSVSAVTSNNNPSSYGQSVTFTATVTSSSGGTPTGTVTFKYGSATLGTASLSAGVATIATEILNAGTHSITAAYTGDAMNSASTSPPISEVIVKAATSTALTSSQNPSSAGQPVTFTAMVTSSTSGIPTGSVTFKSGTKVLGTATLSDGVATLTTSSLTSGIDTITATYTNSADFTSSSTTLTQTID